MKQTYEWWWCMLLLFVFFYCTVTAVLVVDVLVVRTIAPYSFFSHSSSMPYV